MSRPIVFLGPSLSRTDAAAILEADYRPPAAQGDILRALAERPAAIGLIDGIFKNAPTVRHREILWALAEGTPVFGAASMGALRAAELHTNGMIGHGLIYRWFRRYPLLPDDAVAVIHSPAALGAQAMSDALVDIRRSVSAARRDGRLTALAARNIVHNAAAAEFPERRLPLDLQPNRIDQKARDARGLLQVMAAHQRRDDWPIPATVTPPIVHAWLDDLSDSGLSLRP